MCEPCALYLSGGFADTARADSGIADDLVLSWSGLLAVFGGA